MREVEGVVPANPVVDVVPDVNVEGLSGKAGVEEESADVVGAEAVDPVPVPSPPPRSQGLGGEGMFLFLLW